MDALGFRLEGDVDMGGGKRFVTVRPPGGGTALVLARAVNDRQRAAIGNQTGGRVGFFLQTEDFARDHALMQAAGVVFEEEPRQEPFGNRWDLIEYA